MKTGHASTHPAHDVQDQSHWLASARREAFFGPLGVTNIRTFIDPRFEGFNQLPGVSFRGDVDDIGGFEMVSGDLTIDPGPGGGFSGVSMSGPGTAYLYEGSSLTRNADSSREGSR